MKTEDKKLLAEWLGYEGDIFNNPYYFPEENHNQFKEIWKKLTGLEKNSLSDKLKTNPHKDHHPCYVMEIYCIDPVKVLDAIIEVIKEQKIGN